MADIDMLYTGTSAEDQTFGNEEVSDTNKEALQEQQNTIRELMPDVEFLRNYVDAEIAAIVDIRSYAKDFGPLTTKEKKNAFMDEMRARELYIAFLNRFKGDVNNQTAAAEAEAAKA